MGSNHSQLAKLIALRVIVKSFFDNITDLIKANTTWLPAFATALVEEVETVGNNLIGKKAKTTLFESTDNVNKVLTPSRKDISTLKIQIDVYYKKDPARRKVILDDLGYTEFYKKVTARNQLAVIGLLIVFKRNIETYKDEFLARGTPPELLTRLTEHADIVNDANVIQEQLKTNTKQISAEATAELNALHEKVMGICRMAADYYSENRVKKELFTYSRVLNNMGYIPVEDTTTPPTA